MGGYTVKTILNIGIGIILFFVVLSLIKWAVRIFLPIAIIIIAAYIVYKFFNRNRF